MKVKALIDVLSRSLRLARRKLEKEIVESINDHSARPEFWTVSHFNARAEILRNLKEEFFEKISALIETCNAVDSDQCADISDNCELFRTKFVTLWDEFLQLKLVETPVSGNEILDGEKIVSKFIETNAV